MVSISTTQVNINWTKQNLNSSFLTDKWSSRYEEYLKSMDTFSGEATLAIFMFKFLLIADHQIRESFVDNSMIFFLFLNENICCDPSLEPSQWDGSTDGSQNIF